MTATVASVLPLESGDHLTRAEFHRRYCARPEIKKAELVEGVVYVASPVRMSDHAEPHAAIVGWLFAYRAKTPGVRVGDNGSVLLDADNEVQPDAFLFREASQVGARENEDHYIEGAPELVVEIAASSAAYDLFEKMRAYRRNGVQEYIVWQTLESRLDWFRLKDGEYVPVAPVRTASSKAPFSLVCASTCRRSSLATAPRCLPRFSPGE
jgi:Uma2 family endonuclease